MKRLLLLLTLCILPLALTACSSADRTLQTECRGAFQATDGQMNVAGVLESADGTLTIDLSAPDSVAGVRYTFRDGETHTSLDGLDCITPAGSLPPTSVPALLEEVFSRAGEAAYQSTDEGVDVYTLKVRGGTATITAEDGRLLTVTQGGRRVCLEE